MLKFSIRSANHESSYDFFKLNFSTKIFSEKFPESQLLVASKWNEEQRWTRSKATRCKLNDVSKWIGWNAVNFFEWEFISLVRLSTLVTLTNETLEHFWNFYYFFFCPVKEKKSRGKWWNRKVAACVLTERNERPPQRNGDCFVCWFSLCLHLQGKRTEICDRFTSFFSRPVLLGVGNPKNWLKTFFFLFYFFLKKIKIREICLKFWDFLGGWKKMQLA